MSTFVVDFVRRCAICQKNKVSLHHHAPLQPLPTSNFFNDRVHIDLMGPYASSHESHRYILIMADSFTKYTVARPISDKSASTVADTFLSFWVGYFSVPRTVVSDNGKEFTNNVLAEINSYLKINHITTTPYHPQGNAQAERFNRTFLNYLRSFSVDSNLDWWKYIAFAQLSYNTSFHTSAQQMPHFLVFFNNPNLPFCELSKFQTAYAGIWRSDQVADMLFAWRANHLQLTKAADEQKRYYDRKASTKSFHPGDMVLKWIDRGPIRNAKFLPKYHGPFVVIAVSGNNAKIALRSTDMGSWTHFDKLKPFYQLCRPSTGPNGQTSATQLRNDAASSSAANNDDVDLEFSQALKNNADMFVATRRPSIPVNDDDDDVPLTQSDATDPSPPSSPGPPAYEEFGTPTTSPYSSPDAGRIRDPNDADFVPPSAARLPARDSPSAPAMNTRSRTCLGGLVHFK